MKNRESVGFIWAVRDLLIALFVVFLAVSALVLTARTEQKTKEITEGKMVIKLFWDQKADCDIDLWVSGPNREAVGYNHRTGAIFDLLHDHRGYSVEHNHDNAEIAAARSLPEGLYTVNAAMYESWDNIFPVKVWVQVQLIKANGQAIDLFPIQYGELKAPKEEITLINFRLDSSGNLVPYSLNTLSHPLWKDN